MHTQRSRFLLILQSELKMFLLYWNLRLYSHSHAVLIISYIHLTLHNICSYKWLPQEKILGDSSLHKICLRGNYRLPQVYKLKLHYS